MKTIYRISCQNFSSYSLTITAARVLYMTSHPWPSLCNGMECIVDAKLAEKEAYINFDTISATNRVFFRSFHYFLNWKNNYMYS